MLVLVFFFASQLYFVVSFFKYRCAVVLSFPLRNVRRFCVMGIKVTVIAVFFYSVLVSGRGIVAEVQNIDKVVIAIRGDKFLRHWLRRVRGRRGRSLSLDGEKFVKVFAVALVRVFVVAAVSIGLRAVWLVCWTRELR